MAKSTRNKAVEAQAKSGKVNANVRAENYVWKGLRGSGLSPDAQNKLAKKLVPVVQMHMEADYAKAATRGAIQVKNDETKKIKTASKKIMGK